jgi:hypothetical protein
MLNEKLIRDVATILATVFVEEVCRRILKSRGEREGPVYFNERDAGLSDVSLDKQEEN